MATVSAKIPRELREKLEKHGVKLSEVIRRALEVEVLALEEEMLRMRLGEMSSKIKGKISEDDIVRAVRTGREER